MIVATVKNGNSVYLFEYTEQLHVNHEKILFNFAPLRAIILYACHKKILLSVNNQLVLVENNVKKCVLKASQPSNFFWHLAVAGNNFFVHEYGIAPTGIFVSSDLENWERLVINTDVDRKSKHFHYIKYDAHRDWLIATLGDGCINRAVLSKNQGSSWRVFYRGPWQFLPIDVIGDSIVFGMDSGITQGGVGVYNLQRGKWQFIFLRWSNQVRMSIQMAELKRLDNNFWIAALGTPQAIVVSRDLKDWYPLYIASFSKSFNHLMSAQEGRSFVICNTGKNLLLFTKSEVNSALNGTRILEETAGYTDRLKGFGFNLKHVFQYMTYFC